MHSIEVVLVMLLAVVVSGYLTRVLQRWVPVPLPVVQIALGATIAGVFGQGVALDPHLFFVLFLPPLLFLDGWRIPKSGLFRDRGLILPLALGLVVFSGSRPAMAVLLTFDKTKVSRAYSAEALFFAALRGHARQANEASALFSPAARASPFFKDQNGTKKSLRRTLADAMKPHRSPALLA